MHDPHRLAWPDHESAQRRCRRSVLVHRRLALTVPRARDGRGPAARPAGSPRLRETDAWPAAPGRYFVVRGGSLVAWSTEEPATGPTAPFRIVGGHTDSPNLRVKQHPDLSRAGWQLVGRRAVRRRAAQLLARPRPRPLRPGHACGRGRRPADPPGPWSTGRSCGCRSWRSTSTARIGTTGVQAQPAAAPGNAVWGVGTSRRARSSASSPSRLGVAADDVLGWELMTHDLAPSARGRAATTSWSARRAWTTRSPARAVRRRCSRRPRSRPSDRPGARAVRPRGGRQHVRPRRRVAAAGDRARADRAGPRRRLARTCTAGARRLGRARPATWPTPPTRTTPTGTSRSTSIAVNGGPVLKVQPEPALRHRRRRRGARSRWPATRPACRCSATCTAPTCRAARRSARSPPRGLGVTTVDVGAPQLAMHSARELLRRRRTPRCTPRRWPRSSPRPERRGTGQAEGSASRNDVAPGRLARSTRPPWAWATACDDAPGRGRCCRRPGSREPSPRANRSKTFGCSAAGMPGPSSSTLTPDLAVDALDARR